MIWVMIALFFGFIVLGVPIAFAMGISSIIYLLMTDIPLSIAAQRFFSNTQSFPFLAVPFFILAGHVMVRSGIAQRIVNFANTLVRSLPGGLGCVSVVTSMVMAGVSGSSVADAASVGSILIPEMKRKGYGSSFSAAINASSSVVGIIIPPSSTMIIIAWLANLSVAKMFMAGAIPGLIIGLSYLAVTVVISLRRNYPREPRAALRDVFWAFVSSFWALLLTAIILGSITFGIATATESASLAAVYAVFIGFFVHRSLGMKGFITALREAAQGTTIVMMIVCSSTLFTWILIREGIPAMLAEQMLGLGLPSWMLLAMMVLAMFVAGIFMDLVPNLFIFIPVFMPIAIQIGVDPIHFSIITLCSLALGLFTPPVGTTLFISCHLAKISIEETYKDLLPFFLVGAAAVMLITFVPQLTMWLPDLIFG